MSLESKYNLKSPGVKRLMREAIELANPTEEYFACPLEDNLFEWHFTVRGPPGTEFEGGFYHGRILLPSQYPMQPPNIILLTPNGRFEVNKKICLSISGHHPESWQPSWSIRTALLALIAFMPTPASGTIGSLDYTAEERQVLAKKTKNWECSTCGKISEKLSTGGHVLSPKLTQEESTLIKQIALKAEEDANKKEPHSESKRREESTSGERDDSELRQRISTQVNESVDESILAPAADPLLEDSIQRSNTDKLWTAAIWILITIIALLLIRRIFFL
ncbi:ubiquitin-conjugating enzyme E2 J1 [Diabrotica virgifera virgifera]|uniref:Ubiquitin-conjugating enzyme E2 J1-like n=1 Tax=Diabrotica virgifera virgifera TaxID=50390 RepID=A0A6P7FHQ5_DIAVI|nr:ubiquitin-conjugating enzyme E2 J1 [Diabrotica virgifera virgifera]